MPRFFQPSGYLRRFLASLVVSGLFGLVPGRSLTASVVAQLSGAGSLTQQGNQNYTAGDFKAAIARWEQALQQTSARQEQATIHTSLGRAYRQIGQLNQAIAHWQQAIQIYQSQPERTGRRSLAQVLTQQAQAYSELGQHQQAIARLQTAMDLATITGDPETQAIAQGALGRAYWGAGDYDGAIAAHNKAQSLARTLGHSDTLATLLNNLGNGYVSRAERSLYRAHTACLGGNNQTAAELITSLGQDVAAAQSSFHDSVAISQTLENGLTEARALLNLNRLRAQLPAPDLAAIRRDLQRLLTLLDAQPDSREKAFLLINLAESWLQMAEPDSTPATDRAATLASGLALQPLISSPVHLCDRLVNEAPAQSPVPTLGDQGAEFAQIEAILNRALTVTRHLGDGRTESYALGNLGRLYRYSQPDQALQLTIQAQLVAQNANAGDSLYRWQWQAGQLRRDRGEGLPAIASYRQAIATLKTIRSDIVAASRDLQFDFRDAVEPVYRELIELLLEQETGEGKQKAEERGEARGERRQKAEGKRQKAENRMAGRFYSSPFLEEVLDVLESLKLAELQNFFGDDCVEVAQFAGDRSPTGQDRTAVLYSVILNDRTDMILRLPGASTEANSPVAAGKAVPAAATPPADGRLIAYSVPLGGHQMQLEIDQLRRHLEDRATLEYRAQAEKLYDLLIRPLEAELAAAQPHTLVFVNDGALRNVPMAALYDGQQFLIEKYAVATTPGLRLTVRQSGDRSNLQALILGLTVQREQFAPLAFVSEETKEVKQILGGTRLLDGQFNVSELQAHLQKSSYPIVHIATHGKFGPDADSTYLLGFDGKLRLNELDNLLRLRPSLQPVELLTLSACETATGDNRAALGIAGVAVRAGVKSAVATLWTINDAATVPLITEFYRQLRQPQVTKAEALRQAQLTMLRSSQFEHTHPAVWSPFVLIGNWL
ncbi:CHAT domain-containing protein [Leptothermofonsia sichuanensis E412]|uniref:CHAT domain-containing protein n=1 Tax=Leptothermofonsia sichuanensis TaxID=2917832 RepID=UPI001CA60D1D|nr:CHAT domain-containing protein [Leptothermofonsia sichuanensis]QZZ21209.1 CHAT domain-containing protein [Leptothermofonsia sichuanensis E412]